MGCGSSKPPPQQAAPVTAVAAPAPQAPTQGGGGKGKGKGKGKKGKGKGREMKFQVMLEGSWQDFDDVEDRVLKRAFLIGQSTARFHLRGSDYEYNFRTKPMQQQNLGSKKKRDIRAPPGLRAPPKAIVPAGPTIILTVRAGQPGTTIQIKDPNNPGQMISVNVPKGARPGQKMAVPVPEKGQSVQDVVKKQEGWSTGAKTAAGLAAVGAVGGAAVGGALVGDHLAGGTMATDAGAVIADTAADAADWAGDAAADAGDWAEDAAADVGDWGEGAADDVGDWAEGAADDAGDWLGDAAEDTGDWVMSLFLRISH